VIPAVQHDLLTAIKFVNKLLVQGVEIHRARAPLPVGGMTYPAGAVVVSRAQPKMGLIRYLMGRTFYPDNEWTRNRDGSPIRPYDMATDTMFEFMGVRVDPVDEPVTGNLEKVGGEVVVNGRVTAGAAGYVMDGRLNDSFRAANLLLDKSVALRRVDAAGSGLRPGDFLISPGQEAAIASVARVTGVDFAPLAEMPVKGVHAVKRLRIGMYQRYWGGNMDEGWTRLLFEQFGFPFISLKDAEIKQGNLNEHYDVIVIPDDSTAMITGERGVEAGGRSRLPESSVPPEYRSGIGREGVDALRTFVQKGGTLVTLGNASLFAIERFELPIRNVVSARSSTEFWCPGSTLRARFDNTHPLAYGMPSQGLVVYLSGNPVFEVAPNNHSEWYETIVAYGDHELLESGWLIGGDIVAGKSAMLRVKYNDGTLVLIGFRTQHRDQTHGTFKLLFNALLQ
jgi:hypothetical protein